MRLALAGASGSGKTYSSLLIAYGMTADWSKIAVIDSENCSADLYAHLGNYQVLTLDNYSPETYIEAISICEQAGAEVIIIDSISHCWDYLLDYEFTAVLDIAMNHKATTSKDRTGLFTGKPEFVITPQVGQAILRWCNLSTNVQPQNTMPYVQHSSAA